MKRLSVSLHNLPLEVFCLCGFSFLVKGIEKESNEIRLTEEKRFYVMTHRPMSHNTLKVFALDALRRFWRIKKKIDAEGDPTAEQEIEGLRSKTGFFSKENNPVIDMVKRGKGGRLPKGLSFVLLKIFCKILHLGMFFCTDNSSENVQDTCI